MMFYANYYRFINRVLVKHTITYFREYANQVLTVRNVKPTTDQSTFQIMCQI